MQKYIFRLKDVRKSKNLSQVQLAKKINTNQQQISKYENESEIPSVERLVEIAIALEVSLEDLVQIKHVHAEYSEKMKKG